MKKYVWRGIGVLLVMFCCLCGWKETARADSGALDEIEDYEIRIKPASDGSLYMTYHIAWKVLDDESEGPLTWVKIGIPNEYVEDVRPLSDSIKSAKYKRYDGGDYVRVDLDREYHEGEVADIDFSIHQHHMYETTGEVRTYDFTPGWFDEITVDHLAIYWDKAGVDSLPYKAVEDGDDYLWETELAPGDRYNIRVYYPAGVFEKEDDTVNSARQKTDVVLIVLVVGAPILVCILALIFRKRVVSKDHYTADRGMGSTYVGSRRSGGHGGHGGGCACACACACAGGGRAGCARKDFYGTKLETIKVRKALLNYKKILAKKNDM